MIESNLQLLHSLTRQVWPNATLSVSPDCSPDFAEWVQLGTYLVPGRGRGGANDSASGRDCCIGEDGGVMLVLSVLLYIVLHFGYDWVVCLWNRRQARLNREDVEFVRGCCSTCSRIDLKARN